MTIEKKSREKSKRNKNQFYIPGQNDIPFIVFHSEVLTNLSWTVRRCCILALAIRAIGLQEKLQLCRSEHKWKQGLSNMKN